MKEKFVKLTKPLLVAAMALGASLTFNITSILFFGEYEPPKKTTED